MKKLPVAPKTVILLLAAALPSAALAQEVLTGTTAGGSHYRAVVPEGWTPADGLVIWNHGFSLDPVAPVEDEDLGPLAAVHLAQGFAVAASSYSLRGWAVFETVDDLEGMVRDFEARFGVPERVFVYGASLGGIVTAQAIEQADLGQVVGALPVCGALAGSRLWDGGVDLRLLYDLVCAEVPGAAIPGGAAGLPFPPDPAFDGDALALAVNACTGVLLPPPARSAEQAANLDRLLALTGLPESFLIVDMGFVTFGLADLIHDPRKLAGGQAVGNALVDYGDPAANAGIERVAAEPGARHRLIDHYTPTGKVGDVRIVSLHTDKDGLVLVENEAEYASIVPADRLTTGIVVEDVPSHCGFTEAEVVAGWESLRAWVAGAPQPTPADLQAVCQQLAGAGLAEGPCRIDPGFEPPDLDGRVRLRDVCEANGNTLCLNEDRFRVEVEWEDFEGRTGVGRTRPQTDDTGTFWFFDPDNLELTVKVLDGRQFNGRFWVFYGSLTNVEFTLRVTDTETGRQAVFENPSGNFASVGDTEPFR